jgi:hypothetical protein
MNLLARSLILVPVVVGCAPRVEQTFSTSSTAHAYVKPTPHKVTLVEESSTLTNGKLTERVLKFGLAGRQPRRIECGGVSSTDGLVAKGMTSSSVTITIQQTGLDHVKLGVKAVEKHKEGQSATSFSSDFDVVDGVAGVSKGTDKELNPPSGKTAVLVRWVDAQTRKSKTLNVEF